MRIFACVSLFFAFMISGPVLAQTIQIPRVAPFAEDAEIQNKVKNECNNLGSQLSEFTAEFAKQNGLVVKLVDNVDTTAEGRVLKLEITDAVSMGNAFVGHQKFSSIRGELYENGEKVAGFRGRRNSMGGAFAGYKGSCSVLGRTVKALGKDVALWLKNPVDKAQLGDY